MTNSKNTKRALFTSIISLLLCVSMLVGTTFAWFTDSVTTGNNQIVAGNLDVELEYLVNGTWTKVTENTNVFKENTLWEPGHTEVVYLKVSNLGTLALDYKLGVNIAYELTSTNVYDEELKLSEHLQVGVIEGVSTAYANRGLARAAVKSTTPLTDGYAKEGTLYAKNNVPADGKTEQYVALVVYMPEETGNEANYKTGYAAPEITLGINLFATQETYEKDSFDEKYDDEADELLNAYGSAPVNPTGATYIEVKKSDGTKIAAVTVPVDAVADDPEKIEVNVVETALYNGITVADDQEATTFDVTVTGLKEGNTTPVKVELYVGEDLNVQGLYHYGEPVAVYTYNAESGYVIFESATFSPFTMLISTTPAEPEAPKAPEGMPKATVVDADQYENTPINWGSYGGFAPSNPDQQLESAYIFTAPHTGENIDECAYANWYCDYVVSMDKDVAAGVLFLGGNYGSFGWVGFENPELVSAGTEVPLLGSVTRNPWTYEAIASFVGTFTCGVAHLDESLDGATFTVKLRLTNPADATEYYDVNTVTYTFD